MSSLEMERGMLAEARGEIAVADHKASMVLTTLGIGFGALLAGVIAGDWDPTKLGSSEPLWWVGVALACASVVAAALAVWPRWRATDFKQGVYYWGHVARYATFSEFIDALEKTVISEHERTRKQLWALSRILRRKYVCVRAAFVLAAASAVPLAGSTIAN